jgi:LCP family protein required for cell wall assembly
VAGKHGSLIDSMIIANINPVTRKINLVSVPRDLFYNNRKINFIYSLYGMEELKRTLAFITGFQIDKHILIDMYAFIEVIDLIGGIDVHLDKPVIDPTYKTFDGGKWGTMYYRIGDHHLYGRQALRLARSRHTSSDFARSERQHMILAAIRDKFGEFGLGDHAALKMLVRQTLAKTESDINLAEAISYYFRYHNFDIKGGNVISTLNVLNASFTGDAAIKEAGCPRPEDAPEEEKKKCSLMDRGQYILTPREDNWNTVKWYFRQIINS